jgi:RNA polymerase sigma-70 factor (ECF subfamily)
MSTRVLASGFRPHAAAALAPRAAAVSLRHPPDVAEPVASSAAEAADVADAALAARVRGGDTAAFEALFRRHYDGLFAFAERYLRSAEAAEDVTVDVFARVWERRAEWTLRGSPRAYLYSAVRNEALALLRRRRMVERAHADAVREDRRPGMGSAPAPSDADAQANELAAAAEAAIAALPDRTQEAFVLLRQHGLSYAEIAATMEISVKTVEVHVSRALRALREHLAPFLAVLLVSVLR